MADYKFSKNTNPNSINEKKLNISLIPRDTTESIRWDI